MPAPDFAIKTGDTASSLASTLENSGGTAVDLQGATITFKMRSIAGGTLSLAAAATNSQNGTGVDGTKGHVVYNWATSGADTATAGLYVGEWEVRFASGAIQTYPNDSYLLIGITDDL